MAIIALPQPMPINLNATGRYKPLARLKSATITGKINKSFKVLERVRLLGLLPKIDMNDRTGSFPAASVKQILPLAVARSNRGR